MPITWFPGHMHKAQKKIRVAMHQVDLVIEVLDARIPFSSENPLVPKIRGQKPSLKVLNKADMADPQVTSWWLKRLESTPGVTARTHQWQNPGQAKALLKAARGVLPKDRAPGRHITAMILGVPNVGKSTLINTLRGRAVARTGNIPAVTRHQQRVKIATDFTLLDTPGFLWPRLNPPSSGYRLAVTGAIADAEVDMVELAQFAGDFLLQAYPEALLKRYKLKELPEDSLSLLHVIAARRGCLGKGGVVDMQKVSELLIHETRQGKLGRLSFETPAMCVSPDEGSEATQTQGS